MIKFVHQPFVLLVPFSPLNEFNKLNSNIERKAKERLSMENAMLIIILPKVANYCCLIHNE